MTGAELIQYLQTHFSITDLNRLTVAVEVNDSYYNFDIEAQNIQSDDTRIVFEDR